MCPADNKPKISMGMLVKNTAIGLVVCFLFVAVFYLWFGGSGQNLGSEFVNKFGLTGLFFCVLFSDTIPTPGGAIPWIILCVQSQMSILHISIVCLAAYLGAGLIGFAVGKTVGPPKFIENYITKRLPLNLEKLKNRGEIGVGIMAAMPMPMSFATCFGGAFGVTIRCVLVAVIVRIPKLMIYIFTINGSLHLLTQ